MYLSRLISFYLFLSLLISLYLFLFLDPILYRSISSSLFSPYLFLSFLVCFSSYHCLSLLVTFNFFFSLSVSSYHFVSLVVLSWLVTLKGFEPRSTTCNWPCSCFGLAKAPAGSDERLEKHHRTNSKAFLVHTCCCARHLDKELLVDAGCIIASQIDRNR